MGRIRRPLLLSCDLRRAADGMKIPDGFVRFSRGGYIWTARADFADVIRGDSRVLEPEGRLVKEGPARRVWRFLADTAGRATEVYVKEYLLPDLRDLVKYALQPSKAEREFAALAELESRGLGVPEPLAVGVKRSGLRLHGSILVTKSLGDAIPLERFARERARASSHGQVADFTRRLAEFLREVHSAGLLHGDFHPANILIGGGGGSADFHLVDLHDVRLSDSLLAGEQIENLAVLGRFFCQVVPRHWRWRFLVHYFGGRAEARAASRVIEQRAYRGMVGVWSKRDARALGTNKYFRRVRHGRYACRSRRDALADAALALFDDGDPFASAEAVLKDSRSSKVGVFALETDEGVRRVLIKRRNPRPAARAIVDSFRRSRAMKGFLLGVAFENRQIPTPRVLAALDERRFGILKQSYLVQEFLGEAENLGAVMASGGQSPLGGKVAADRPGFIRRLAHTLRRMHWTGLSVRDLKSANILLAPGGGGVRVLVADLDAASVDRRAASESSAMRDIARLYFDASYLGAMTKREAVVFLNEYLGYPERRVLLLWVSGISRMIRSKRKTFRPKGVFAQKADSSATGDAQGRQGQ